MTRKDMKAMKIINYKDSFDDLKPSPIWECPVSEFDWEYSKDEVCLIIKG